MSAYTIAKEHIDAVLESSSAQHIAASDALHALLVTVVQAYKAVRGIANTRQALEFQADNLEDDIDYAFIRP